MSEKLFIHSASRHGNAVREGHAAFLIQTTNRVKIFGQKDAGDTKSSDLKEISEKGKSSAPEFDIPDDVNEGNDVGELQETTSY